MIFEDRITTRNFDNNLSHSFDNKDLPRFRWYNYKEGFSSQLVEEAISSVDFKSDDYILDPFNGNGTVTLTASINNIKSIGLEVNPFVASMSKTKLHNSNSDSFKNNIDFVSSFAKKSKKSNLLKYSTFSELGGKNKWLFNSNVLNSFEGGWHAANQLSKNKRELFQLALIGAAMDNCNATKDGKCLKYRNNWIEREFDKNSFLTSFQDRLEIISTDLQESFISKQADIINGDSRTLISKLPHKFKLCVTSPPYLNSFDYTDIYRPELFLGKFINTKDELQALRYKTIRSHVEIKLPLPKKDSFGEIYKNIHKSISQSDNLWSKQIPIMIQSYFEDMEKIIWNLYKKSKKGSELWLVVANSIYSEIEIPVDLILAEIGTRKGWKLKRIEVLRNIQRRKTKYMGNLTSIRESLIVFENK
jgi:DNA modification methylase